MINPYIFIQMCLPLLATNIPDNTCASLGTAQRYREKEVGIAIRTRLKPTAC